MPRIGPRRAPGFRGRGIAAIEIAAPHVSFARSARRKSEICSVGVASAGSSAGAVKPHRFRLGRLPGLRRSRRDRRRAANGPDRCPGSASSRTDGAPASPVCRKSSKRRHVAEGRWRPGSSPRYGSTVADLKFASFLGGLVCWRQIRKSHSFYKFAGVLWNPKFVLNRQRRGEFRIPHTSAGECQNLPSPRQARSIPCGRAGFRARQARRPPDRAAPSRPPAMR